MSWGSAPTLSVGVEEELFLVDAGTLEAAPVFEQVVEQDSPRIKAEVFACIVEVATPPVRSAHAALEELSRLRLDVAGRAARVGATVLASGTHPTARGRDQAVLDRPRYRDLLAQWGRPLAETQLVCGLHVHVAMPDRDACLRAFEGVVPWLPLLLALSANSPFAEGGLTGLRSARAERLLLLPTGGTPPLLPDWDAWEEATAGDDTRRHWDAWPRPEHGTLEVRVTDQQTDVRRSAGLAAIVQALAASALEEAPEPYDRELYAIRRAEAARQPPDPGEVEALRARVEPMAQEPGTREFVTHVLDGRPEAERQLALGPRAALRDLAARSLPSSP